MVEGDEKKLGVLLSHWIEHNLEHAEEFKRWAEKAKGFGKTVVHDEILVAVQHIERANESLETALEELNKQLM